MVSTTSGNRKPTITFLVQKFRSVNKILEVL